MSARQTQLVVLLGRQAHTLVEVARTLDLSVASAQRVLDACYRRGWVTITDTGRWCTTDKGRRRVAA